MLLLGLVLLKKVRVALLVKKVELEEEKGRQGGVTLGMEVETGERQTDEISIDFFVFVFWVMGFGAVAGWRRWIMNEEGEEVGVEAASFEWLTKIFFVWT